MLRFVEPERRRLELTNGDFLIVRRRLTAGETRAMLARLYVSANGNGPTHVDPMQVGISTIIAYLIDWSFTDAQGMPVAVRGLAPADLTAVLDSLDPDSFREVLSAIEAHETAMAAERDAEKKTPRGVTPSEPISSSPHGSGGIPVGSAI